MTSSMKTILIIGGTSGIGEAFAKRFHGMGKDVIVTGRRQERLDQMQQSMQGLETYSFDLMDLKAIPSHVEALFTKYPAIDTVWINGGIQFVSDIKDLSSSSDERVVNEINTNVTGPMIIARHVIPRLIAQQGPTQIMITSSGLGFVPNGRMSPVYCSTKAAVHAYLVGIRQALSETNVNVIEIAPPLVDTDLVNEFRKSHLSKAPAPPMTLTDFTKDIFQILDANDAADLKEVSAGSAVPRVEAWRSGIGPVLEKMGLGG